MRRFKYWILTTSACLCAAGAVLPSVSVLAETSDDVIEETVKSPVSVNLQTGQLEVVLEDGRHVVGRLPDVQWFGLPDGGLYGVEVLEQLITSASSIEAETSIFVSGDHLIDLKLDGVSVRDTLLRQGLVELVYEPFTSDAERERLARIALEPQLLRLGYWEWNEPSDLPEVVDITALETLSTSDLTPVVENVTENIATPNTQGALPMVVTTTIVRNGEIITTTVINGRLSNTEDGGVPNVTPPITTEVVSEVQPEIVETTVSEETTTVVSDVSETTVAEGVVIPDDVKVLFGPLVLDGILYADSDGDGINDYSELNYLGTDPLVKDVFTAQHIDRLRQVGNSGQSEYVKQVLAMIRGDQATTTESTTTVTTTTTSVATVPSVIVDADGTKRQYVGETTNGQAVYLRTATNGQQTYHTLDGASLSGNLTPQTMANVNQTVQYASSCQGYAAQGVYNIPNTSPHYQASLDRDGDGVACELDTVGMFEDQSASVNTTNGLLPLSASDGLTALNTTATTAVQGLQALGDASTSEGLTPLNASQGSLPETGEVGNRRILIIGGLCAILGLSYFGRLFYGKFIASNSHDLKDERGEEK